MRSNSIYFVESKKILFQIFEFFIVKDLINEGVSLVEVGRCSIGNSAISCLNDSLQRFLNDVLQELLNGKRSPLLAMSSRFL